jgi:hypothetical protein
MILFKYPQNSGIFLNLDVVIDYVRGCPVKSVEKKNCCFLHATTVEITFVQNTDSQKIMPVMV